MEIVFSELTDGHGPMSEKQNTTKDYLSMFYYGNTVQWILDFSNFPYIVSSGFASMSPTLKFYIFLTPSFSFYFSFSFEVLEIGMPNVLYSNKVPGSVCWSTQGLQKKKNSGFQDLIHTFSLNIPYIQHNYKLNPYTYMYYQNNTETVRTLFF